MRFENVANAASILHYGRARPSRNAPHVYRRILYPHGHRMCAETNTVVACEPPSQWFFRPANASCL